MGLIASIRSNIGKLYCLAVMQNALTVIPILVPFLESNGITLGQVFLLQGIFTITWVITDVPTGYLADTWGRRSTLITSFVFFCLSGIAFALGTTFWHFCIVEILFGTAISLYSGTADALTYDTLLELGEEGSYRKISSYQNIVSWLSTALAGILGGLIATQSLRAAASAMLPFFLIGLIIALTLQEPKRHLIKKTDHIKGMLRVFSETLFHNRVLRSIILIFSLIGALTFSLVWFTQPYQTLVHMPLYLFGISNAIFMLGMIAVAKSAHYLEKQIDDRWLLVLLTAIVLLAFFALGLSVSVWGLLFLLIGRSTYGALNPLTTDLINRVTASDKRATVLSVRSFTYNLIFSIASPALGYIAGAFTLNQAILMTGVVGGIAAIPVLLLLKGTWKELPA